MKKNTFAIFLVSFIVFITVCTILLVFIAENIPVNIFGIWGIPFVGALGYIALLYKYFQSISIRKKILSFFFVIFCYFFLLHYFEKTYYGNSYHQLPNGNTVTRYSLNAIYNLKTPEFMAPIVIVFLLSGAFGLFCVFICKQIKFHLHRKKEV